MVYKVHGKPVIERPAQPELPPNPSGQTTVPLPPKDRVVIGKDPALLSGPTERSLSNTPAARLHGEPRPAEKNGFGKLIDALHKQGPLDLGRLARNYAAKKK
jgi:hypothetical protein